MGASRLPGQRRGSRPEPCYRSRVIGTGKGSRDIALPNRNEPLTRMSGRPRGSVLRGRVYSVSTSSLFDRARRPAPLSSLGSRPSPIGSGPRPLATGRSAGGERYAGQHEDGHVPERRPRRIGRDGVPKRSLQPARMAQGDGLHSSPCSCSPQFATADKCLRWRAHYGLNSSLIYRVIFRVKFANFYRSITLEISKFYSHYGNPLKYKTQNTIVKY